MNTSFVGDDAMIRNGLLMADKLSSVCLLAVMISACGTEPTGPDHPETQPSALAPASINTADFRDDFEGTPEGSPSTDYTVINPDAQIQNLPQLDGSTG